MTGTDTRAPVADDGGSSAEVLKYLGSQFERDVIEVARPLLGTQQAGPDSAFGQALLASPGFSIRGGASDVLLSLIARQEQL